MVSGDEIEDYVGLSELRLENFAEAGEEHDGSVVLRNLPRKGHISSDENKAGLRLRPDRTYSS